MLSPKLRNYICNSFFNIYIYPSFLILRLAFPFLLFLVIRPKKTHIDDMYYRRVDTGMVGGRGIVIQYVFDFYSVPYRPSGEIRLKSCFSIGYLKTGIYHSGFHYLTTYILNITNVTTFNMISIAPCHYCDWVAGSSSIGKRP